jgi:3-oxoacyl-[acyl-carrier-protein] synthase-3
MNLQINTICDYLPEKIVTNDDLEKENTDWNLSLLSSKVGVSERRIAGEGETALDLAFAACEKLRAVEPDLFSTVDGLIFCTQTPDYIMPPNSSVLHEMLNLPDDVMAFDFNLACSGYIYGLSIAEGLLKAGSAKNILLINADTYSKLIHPKDRSTRALFGDGATVSHLSLHKSADLGLKKIQCLSYGKGCNSFIVKAGGQRMPLSIDTQKEMKDLAGNIRTSEHIKMDGMQVLNFVNEKIPKHISEFLNTEKLSVTDIDLFIFHQASKLALTKLQSALELKDEQVFSHLEKNGNTVSASIPLTLKAALDQKVIKKGNKVLLVGFGVGLSYGSALLHY